jgi:hypothetical protein
MGFIVPHLPTKPQIKTLFMATFSFYIDQKCRSGKREDLIFKQKPTNRQKNWLKNQNLILMIWSGKPYGKPLHDIEFDDNNGQPTIEIYSDDNAGNLCIQ